MSETRFSYRDYYLERPHPDRGGSWYACTYDAGSRSVRRKSLRTADFEEAKNKLVDMVSVAPAETGRAASPADVPVTAVLEAYLEDRGASTRSVEYAERVAELAAEYLIGIKRPGMALSDWTPSRQLAFAKWCSDEKNHKVSTIKRTFNVIGAAFNDAARIRIRKSPVGQEIEGSLVSHAPKIAWSEKALARELKVATQSKPTFVPSIDEMALFIDNIQVDHVRRYMLIALCTWARPEAVMQLGADQWDTRTNVVDLNPQGRAQTNKVRSAIYCPRNLRALFEGSPEGSLLTWRGDTVASVRTGIRAAAKRSGVPITRKTPRTFMATTVRRLCPAIPREKRSIWLGHSVEEGSKTTDFYEITDADYLADVALATDYVISQVQLKCKTSFAAVELRLTAKERKVLGVAK